MKHTFDETTMQAAIDAACEALGKGDFRPTAGLLETVPGCSDWSQETHARLDLLKTALDNLPEPPPPVVDGKTPGQVCHESMYNTPEWKWLLAGDKAACESAASAVLAAFGNKPAEIPWTEWHGGGCPLKDEQVEEWGCELRDGRKHTNVGVNSAYWRWQHLSRHGDIIAYRVTKWKEGFGPVDWKARAEKAEAELANWKEAAQVAKWQRDLIIDESTDKTGRILELEKLSTLRPISEAGDVPAGCVRYFFRILQCSFSIGTLEQGEDDTHFADIRLPVEAPIVSINTQDCEPMSQNTAEALSAMIQAAATPQTFEEQGKTWNVHTPGDPMPCDGKIKIDILDRSGVVYCDQPAHHHDSNFWTAEYCNPIIGWRYADEPSGKSTSDATITPWTPAVGDVVTLKSGSPKMTVTVLSVHKDNASVSWFNDGVVNSASFNVSTLIPA